MTNIDRLLQGAIDMHVHAAPYPFIPRRLDALEAARQARQMGMRAIVLKNRHYPTAPLAIMVSQLVPEVKVLGGICLDFDVGGLNFHAVESSAKLGARVVWMPTTCSANSKAPPSAPDFALEGEGLSILDTEGKLVPEIGRILSLVKKYDMVLASGHVSPAETFALIDEALKTGIRKLVITHPLESELVKQALSLEDVRRLAQTGALIECCCVGLLPTEFRLDPRHIAEAIRSIGVEHFILSTDLGQVYNLPPAEGMRLLMAVLLRNGISEAEIELMAKVNPARLLGLD